MDKSAPDQKQLLTEVIQKLMVVLGADLTLSKIHNVHGMTLSEDGTVTDIQTEPEVLLREIIDEFVGLSSEIVKQITEILVSKQMHSQAAIALPSAPIQPGQNIAAPLTMPTPTPLPVTPVAESPSATIEPTSTVASAPEPTPTPMQQPTNDPFPNTQPTQPQVTQPLPQQPTPVQPGETTPQPTPTVNPPAPVTTPPQAQTQQNDPDMQHIINEALKQTK